jgi:hypothetical protein
MIGDIKCENMEESLSFYAVERSVICLNAVIWPDILHWAFKSTGKNITTFWQKVVKEILSD